MATDAVLAQWCSKGMLGAAIRFYQMDPPAVTIGRHQRFHTVLDEQLLEERGWQWSRRATGGGALLHHRELNYAVVMSKGALAPFGSFGFQTAFRLIMTGLQRGLAVLGCQPVLYLGSEGMSSTPAPSAHGLCERSLTRHEIAIDGRKAVAAAQLMLPDACLQHGTIYLQAPRPEDRFWPANSVEEPESRWWDTTQLSISENNPAKCLESVLLSEFTAHLGVVACDWTPVAEFDNDVERQFHQWMQDGYHRRR